MPMCVWLEAFLHYICTSEGWRICIYSFLGGLLNLYSHSFHHPCLQGCYHLYSQACEHTPEADASKASDGWISLLRLLSLQLKAGLKNLCQMLSVLPLLSLMFCIGFLSSSPVLCPLVMNINALIMRQKRVGLFSVSLCHYMYDLVA